MLYVVCILWLVIIVKFFCVLLFVIILDSIRFKCVFGVFIIIGCFIIGVFFGLVNILNSLFFCNMLILSGWCLVLSFDNVGF